MTERTKAKALLVVFAVLGAAALASLAFGCMSTLRGAAQDMEDGMRYIGTQMDE